MQHRKIICFICALLVSFLVGCAGETAISASPRAPMSLAQSVPAESLLPESVEVPHPSESLPPSTIVPPGPDASPNELFAYYKRIAPDYAFKDLSRDIPIDTGAFEAPLDADRPVPLSLLNFFDTGYTAKDVLEEDIQNMRGMVSGLSPGVNPYFLYEGFTYGKSYDYLVSFAGTVQLTSTDAFFSDTPFHRYNVTLTEDGQATNEHWTYYCLAGDYVGYFYDEAAALLRYAAAGQFSGHISTSTVFGFPNGPEEVQELEPVALEVAQGVLGFNAAEPMAHVAYTSLFSPLTLAENTYYIFLVFDGWENYESNTLLGLVYLNGDDYSQWLVYDDATRSYVEVNRA